MNLDHYQSKIVPGYHDYEFYSFDPKGRIKKVVRFTLAFLNGTPVYNLSFGNWNNVTKSIDDVAISNNGDKD